MRAAEASVLVRPGEGYDPCPRSPYLNVETARESATHRRTPSVEVQTVNFESRIALKPARRQHIFNGKWKLIRIIYGISRRSFLYVTHLTVYFILYSRVSEYLEYRLRLPLYKKVFCSH